MTMDTKDTARNASFYNEVYTVLVEFGGASESMRDSFIHNHTSEEFPCAEWRFCGKLGYGGKYWRRENRVSCYREDETEARTVIMGQLDTKLAAIARNSDSQES